MDTNKIDMNKEYTAYSSQYADFEGAMHEARAIDLQRNINEYKEQLKSENDPERIDAIKAKIDVTSKALSACERIAEKTSELKSLNNGYEQYMSQFSEVSLSGGDNERIDIAFDKFDKESLNIAKSLNEDKKQLFEQGFYEKFAAIHSVTSFLKHPSLLDLAKVVLNVKHYIDSGRGASLRSSDIRADRAEDVRTYRMSEYKARLENLKPQFALPGQNYEKLSKDAYQYSKQLANYETKAEQQSRINDIKGDIDRVRTSINQDDNAKSNIIARMENLIKGYESIIRGIAKDFDSDETDKEYKLDDNYEDKPLDSSAESIYDVRMTDNNNFGIERENEDTEIRERDNELSQEEKSEQENENKADREIDKKYEDKGTDKETESDKDNESDKEEPSDKDNEQDTDKEGKEEEKQETDRDTESDKDSETDKEEPSEENNENDNEENEDKQETDKADSDNKEDSEKEENDKDIEKE